MNPFDQDNENDKAQLWDMLVKRDSLAFVNQDWDLVKEDFVTAHFMGIHAHNESNPDLWKISFPNLASYREEWLKQAKAFDKDSWTENPYDILLKSYVFR